jgi:nitronate monooxygenase
MQRWHGREDELAADLPARGAEYRAAAREGNFDTAVVWAGEAVDLISTVRRAGALVEDIVSEAAARLRSGARLATPIKENA